MGNTFKVGELLNERSPVSKTWVNFDGSYTVEMYNDTIHYKDENGQYKEIDPTLSKGNNSEYFQTSGVPFDVKVPQVFTSGYSISEGDEKLTFIPVGASEASGLSNIDKLNEIIYLNVWQDTNVKLEVTANSLKETIVLKSEKAPSTFRFEIESGQSDVTLGNLKLAPAWLVDAAGEHRDVNQHLTIEGEKLFVTLQVDTTDLVYPIEVDPTVLVSNLAGVKANNVVMSNTPNNVYNSEQYATLLSNDIRRIYMKYPDMLKNIPSDATITSAKLTVHASDFNGVLKLRTHAVSSDYNPDTLTWSNQPLISDNLVSPEVTLQAGSPSWNDIDITSIVQAKLNGTQVSAVVLKSSDLNSGGRAAIWLADNQYMGTRPFLTIEFNAPPSKPTVLKPNGGETITGSYEIGWTEANDIRDFTYDPFPMSDAIIFSNMVSIGQSFRMLAENAKIKRIYLRLGVSNSGIAYKMSLYRTVNSSGYWLADRTQLVAQGDVVFESGASPAWCYADLHSVDVDNGGRYAIVIEAKDGSSINYQVARTNTYRSNANGCAMTSASGGNFTGYEMDFLYKIVYSAGTLASQLKYNVQLTTNNGSTWKDIIPLSSAGATSQSYDFSNEPETSTAKVRIRAYDGVSYGDWDESDGVFTINKNDPPEAPDNLYPNGTTEDRAKPIRLSWRHNDPDGNDPQSKFDLQWRLQPSNDWTTITQETVNQYYEFPANTLPSGKIEWRVRTYDQGGLASPYSYIALFTATEKPSPPIITSPDNDSTIPYANPTVTWSHPNQAQYSVKVIRASDNLVVFESTNAGTNKALTITTALDNNTSYYIQVAVADYTGLWSDYAQVKITVAYTPPNTPTFSATTDNINGYVTLNVVNPAPADGKPRTEYNEIFRKTGNGEWIKIAKIYNPDTGLVEFIDRMPTSNAAEVYKVRAVGSNWGYIDSEQVTVVVKLRDTQIAVASNASSYVTLRKREGSKEVTGRQAATTDFVGRPYPLTEFGSNLNRSYEYRYKVNEWDDVEQIRTFAQLGETFILRDNWGKKDFVTFNSVSIEEGRTFWYVSIQPVKVYYKEGIE